MINLRCCCQFSLFYINIPKRLIGIIFWSVDFFKYYIHLISFSILRCASAKNQLLCIQLCMCVFALWFSCVIFFLFAFNGAKNGLNILSINSLSQNISFLCTFYFWVYFISYHSFSACSFQFPRKNFLFFFISSLLNIFLSLSHCEKKISFLQSREFRSFRRFLYLCVCIME